MRSKPWKGDRAAAADGSAGGEHRVRAHVEYWRLAGGHPFPQLRAARRQPRTALIRLDAQERQTAGAVRPDAAVHLRVVQESLCRHERRSAFVLDQDNQKFYRLGTACVPVNELDVVGALIETLPWRQC